MIPSDPVSASKMRTFMAKYDSEMIGPLFAIYLKKFRPEGAEDFLARAVPLLEKFCANTTDGKWLMGTDDLTLADIHMGAMWDFIYVYNKAEAYQSTFSLIKLETTAPLWISYMERLRAHPKIAPTCMNQEAANRMAERSAAWTAEEKC